MVMNCLNTPRGFGPSCRVTAKQSFAGIIYQAWKNVAPTSVTTSILAAFGIDHLYIVELPTQVGELVVPEIVWRIRGAALPIFRDLINHLGRDVHDDGPEDDLSVFFSRRHLKSPARSPYEADIEEIAQEQGYKIVFPENLTLNEQIALMRRTRVIAGIGGSAMHNAVFLRPGSKTVCFDAHLIHDQYLIEDLFQLDAVHIDIANRIDIEETRRALANAR